MGRVSFKLIPLDHVIEINNANFGERTMLSNLTIVMAGSSDSEPHTVFICIATSDAGQDTATAELTVHGEYHSLTRMASFAWSFWNSSYYHQHY